MIGLPLRLLAREVYNKVRGAGRRRGGRARSPARRRSSPPNPRFWVSTVEAMPRDLDVAFLAIDEVQLGADLERGHVFTDRMLNRRGREETLVLGAATVRPMVERLLPGAHVLTRPRLSQLTFAGEKKITRLPRRSAIVAFSAEEVYAIAELIRRQRGGAAVVLGALSPRTRNAQVALYQSGDVDYLVATDAIGMGLNLDVDHVAFASDRKFDGYQFRKLNPAELAQIAGRAGRATRDGTFGTTGRCPPFETELVQALESHSFEPIKMLQWRNTALDFSSIGALQASLAEMPKENGLTRAPIAEDILVLEHAARDDDVRALATTREAVERLWEVCQVPDYRKISPATHAELATTLYGFLMREGTIPIDWFARQVEQADHDRRRHRHAVEPHRPYPDLDLRRQPPRLAGRSRALAGRDARASRTSCPTRCMSGLTERFVDRRTSVLMRRLRENTALETDISKTGEVVVEGHVHRPARRLHVHARRLGRGLGSEGARRRRAEGAGRRDRRARRHGCRRRPTINSCWPPTAPSAGSVSRSASSVAGEEVLKPRVRIIADEHLTGAPRDAVQARLDLWLKAHIEKLLGPLFQLAAAEDVTGHRARRRLPARRSARRARARSKVAEEVKGLDQPARATLRKYGVRFGAYHIYVPALLKPAPRVLATQLWALKHGGPETQGARRRSSNSPPAAAPRSPPTRRSPRCSIAPPAIASAASARCASTSSSGSPTSSVRRSPGAPARRARSRPAAVDGFGFIVTVADDARWPAARARISPRSCASLGYRMEKRPKPAAGACAAGAGGSDAATGRDAARRSRVRRRGVDRNSDDGEPRARSRGCRRRGDLPPQSSRRWPRTRRRRRGDRRRNARRSRWRDAGEMAPVADAGSAVADAPSWSVRSRRSNRPAEPPTRLPPSCRHAEQAAREPRRPSAEAAPARGGAGGTGAHRGVAPGPSARSTASVRGRT